MALRSPVSYNQYRGHVLVTAPAVEPVTAADVQNQLGIDVGEQDSQIELYITAARGICEQMTGLALITQVWRMTLDRWPSSHREPWWDGVREGAIGDLYASGRASQLLLPRYPLQTVDSVKADGETITVADYFNVDTTQKPGRLVLKYGETFPPIIDTANAVDVEYTAGFGDTATDVPAALRLAIIQMASHMFEHRGDGCSTENAMLASGAKAIFDSYKVRGL